MYSEDDFVLISGLQHLVFCERQCALIHIEGMWAENSLTAQGRVLHDKTHEAGTEYSGSIRVVRGLRLRSLRLSIAGVADVVEFHRDCVGISLPSVDGTWRPFPVEYKRGRPKPDECDVAQLCAQALCLEEMLTCQISEGAIFYGEPRRRQSVYFDSGLRARTEDSIQKLRTLIEHRVTPPAVYAKRCKACSLIEICRPATAGSGKSVSRYLGQILSRTGNDLGGDP